jgi:hypothetical protein
MDIHQMVTLVGAAGDDGTVTFWIKDGDEELETSIPVQNIRDYMQTGIVALIPGNKHASRILFEVITKAAVQDSPL